MKKENNHYYIRERILDFQEFGIVYYRYDIFRKSKKVFLYLRLKDLDNNIVNEIKKIDSIYKIMGNKKNVIGFVIKGILKIIENVHFAKTGVLIKVNRFEKNKFKIEEKGNVSDGFAYIVFKYEEYGKCFRLDKDFSYFRKKMKSL